MKRLLAWVKGIRKPEPAIFYPPMEYDIHNPNMIIDGKGYFSMKRCDDGVLRQVRPPESGDRLIMAWTKEKQDDE